MHVPARSTAAPPWAHATDIAGRDALIDRRAADTAALLRAAQRRRAAVEVQARLRRAAGARIDALLAELRQLDDEVVGLRRTLRERPWTEAL